MDEQDNSRQDVRHTPSSASEEDELRQKQEASEQLQSAIDDTKQVLVTATTVFPFTLFPDTLTVDRAKLIVNKRSFFGASQALSVRIEDVSNVTVELGPIFGTVIITSQIFNVESYRISHFWRQDALRLKQVTQGFIVAIQRDIDIKPIPTKELTSQLEQLGSDDHVT